MKKIYLLLILLFSCGFTSTYNLNISNNYFKEDIDLQILNNYKVSNNPEIESDNQQAGFINSNHLAISGVDKYYKKSITDYGEYTNVNLKYSFDNETFKDAISLNTCFENSEFLSKKSYKLTANGEFYCLYSDEVVINITTNNKVVYNNADKVEGNTYTWIVNNSNYNDVNIIFEVKKGFPYKDVIKYSIIIGGIIFILLLIVVKLYLKTKRNNAI